MTIMSDQKPYARQTFGGAWTEQKLNILERYLDAYTTALSDRPFSLWYIDAFAGTGNIELPSGENDDDIRHFISGSAERAIKIGNKPFDKLIFVEQSRKRYRELVNLRETHADRNIEVVNCDANVYLSTLDDNWHGKRGVLFLDPFGAQVRWDTLARIASYQALDTWLLFSVNAVSRMLPKTQQSDQISEKWAQRLTTVFGDESWRDLYQKNPQQDMFNAGSVERTPGVEGLCEIYKDKLKNLFDSRYLDKPCTLRNSKNSPLFEFIFCAGHPKGANIAKRIAKHIVEHL